MLFVVVVFLCLFVGLLSNLVFITRLHVNLVILHKERMKRKRVNPLKLFIVTK